MYDDWPETTKVLSAHLRDLRGGAPDVMKAFSGIAQTALAPKALDAKTKELIALGIGIAIRCDDCIAFHIKAAVERGATREEISETLGIAIYMGAGPSVMYASHAFAALQSLKLKRRRSRSNGQPPADPQRFGLAPNDVAEPHVRRPNDEDPNCCSA